MNRKCFLALWLWTTAAMSFAKTYTFVVGSYTDAGSKGIYSLRFDSADGSIVWLDSLQADNPSYLTLARNNRLIYAVNETDKSSSGVVAIAFDAATGKMRMVNREKIDGDGPCYVAANDRFAMTADYQDGSYCILPINSDGALAPQSQRFESNQQPGGAAQQGSPHAHCIRFMPGEKTVLATDFSADRLLRFDLAKDGKSFVARGIAAKLDRGNAPRHFDFTPNGRYLYVLGEIGGTVTAFKMTGKRLKRIQVIRSDEAYGKGSADIHVSPDGRFLYTSNRLRGDGIMTFAINPKTGRLSRIANQPTLGHPRQFNLTPDGQYLFCACRDGNAIQVFKVDQKTGKLSPTPTLIPLSKPTCVQFVK